jgi:hypothetical protein
MDVGFFVGVVAWLACGVAACRLNIRDVGALPAEWAVFLYPLCVLQGPFALVVSLICLVGRRCGA